MEVKDNDTGFSRFADSLPQIVWTSDPRGSFAYLNRRWYDFTGLDASQSLEMEWLQFVHPDDARVIWKAWKRSVDAGTRFEAELRLRSAKGAYSWFLCQALPARDTSGSVAGWSGAFTNIDTQKNAEEALRRTDEQHRLALEAAGLGTWSLNVGTGIVSWDEQACRLFGAPPDHLRRIALEDAFSTIHPDDRPRLRDYVASALAPEADGRYLTEFRVVLPDGNIRWIRSEGHVVFAGEGKTRHAVRLSGTCADATERRASQEAQQLLTRELTHRVKNLFAITSGLVSMTARTARDPKDMADALRGRLAALSRAHELVRPTPSPEGGQPSSSTNLARLIEAIIAPYKQEGDDRILTEGPPVEVEGSAITSLALVLHELTTNAAKYGCLSTPSGKLTVRWDVDDETVRLLWTEMHGPRLTEAPTFEGFGHHLAQRSIGGQLGGTLEHDWRPGGLEVRMTLPLARLCHKAP
ncbi:sensor histidine kinase [Microvirga sp. 2MCAF38]|uniref:sensor histidine kinase n=1 Tax=Microvirga sp. 2MCAF38 TaxID=3232989 RepID=UPI003F961671